MQTLAEDRWHDYDWDFGGNRFAHWGKGSSWIQDPAADRLGADQVEALTNTSTMPSRTADLAFYIIKGEPLPKECFEGLD
jgi:hypothetical protein